MPTLLSDPWIYPCAAGLLFGALVFGFLLFRRRHPPAPLEIESESAAEGPPAEPSLQELKLALERLERRLESLERRLEVEEETA